ncbi:excisionase family DNA binding protein [Paenibacillus endophyticus]|uniref:Excisionase family DNA binding protein n=1 Tax=Paenibacillus endophyticus TaxID=1294268 RepID=A0A7W5C841_9BACL|nr:helix-turn-helix domain-containing protein [Paenibacillus endophyticus]MBB3152460.1 excisionase family DNA binding protein [Paenibacillus endophyticus]
MLDNYEDILTVNDLADMLKIGKNTAYQLINTGQIKSVKLGRIHRIPRQNVIDYIIEKSR